MNILYHEIITVISKREKTDIPVNRILYCMSDGKIIEIHMTDGSIITTRTTISRLEQMLDKRFVKIHRGCLVSAKAIHSIDSMVHLLNGEALSYTIRKKKQIKADIKQSITGLIDSTSSEGVPSTETEYAEYFRCFDKMPFAFADIEMVIDEDTHTSGWIIRYGNEALERLTGHPLSELIGKNLHNIFNGIKQNRLLAYERAALMKETLVFFERRTNPERNIKVICFPSFELHCSCMMFDLSTVNEIPINECSPARICHSEK